MKRIHPFLAAAAGLAAASLIALTPVLASAGPASAATAGVKPASTSAFCTGTSLVAGASDRGPVQLRVPTVGNGTGNWHCNLEFGDDNVAVARLQVALDSSNCELGAGLTVDGDYGSLTRQAVVNVQKARGAPADGEYGPVTGAVMLWPVAGSNDTRCGSIIT
jgi:peptidoglycan hydrolase-like protein with peptidoglycan-binding domain